MKIPNTQLISKEEHEETMRRMMDIQIAADAATKALNNLKAVLVTISFWHILSIPYPYPLVCYGM